jgi:hypothetical protein
MPERDKGGNSPLRLILLTVGAVAFLALAGGIIYKLSQNGARQYQPQSQAHYTGNTCVQAPPYIVAPCLDEGSVAKAEQQRSDDDLRAQQEMADWAFVVAVTGIGGFFASLVGVGLLFFTFRQTGEQLELVRRAYVADHRTWLKVELVAINTITFKPDKSIRVHFTVQITNTGDLPAYSINVFGESFRTRGIVVGNAKRDVIVAQEKARHSAFPDGGFLLLPKEPFTMSFGGDARLDPESEEHTARQIASGVLPQNLVFTISGVFGAIYKSAASDQWHHTAHIFLAVRTNKENFDENFVGEIPAEGLGFRVYPYMSSLT